MNFIKYFFSEIFRLFKLVISAAFVLTVGFLIYKFFFAEPGLAENYAQNRAQILSMRDFAREIRPNKIYFNVLFDGDKIESL